MQSGFSDSEHRGLLIGKCLHETPRCPACSTQTRRTAIGYNAGISSLLRRHIIRAFKLLLRLRLHRTNPVERRRNTEIAFRIGANRRVVLRRVCYYTLYLSHRRARLYMTASLFFNRPLSETSRLAMVVLGHAIKVGPRLNCMKERLNVVATLILSDIKMRVWPS